ncbi:MAG: dimethylarginine dimethylaminohydrolase [Rhodospirillales bacterium]|nr:dimethylarginine dimethylaminohydrolase [Rhodospirillales bacterium]
MGHSTHFTNAIVRSPGKSIAQGLRAVDMGNPDPDLFAAQHDGYIQALIEAGISVNILPPLEEFPDSVFIEDSALCLPSGAVVLRPGAATRTGESDVMAEILRSCFDDVRNIGEGGFIEGGDILVTEHEIIVGLSARTDAAGAEALQDCVAAWGGKVRILETPADILHFKTACGLLDEETILLTEALNRPGFFDAYRTLIIPEGEEAAANAIGVNGRVFISDGFPRTAEMLEKSGYSVIAIATGEAAKVDGGLSCMSLRFTPTL